MPVNTRTNHPAYKSVWEGEDTFATTMLVLFVDTYGTEGFTWLPEAIAVQIEEDFNVKLPRANFDRLMAAINLSTGDDFFKVAADFVALTNVLTGDLFDPRTWDPADAQEIAWAVSEALLITEPDEEEPFTEEIRAYIAAVLDAEGIMQPPDILRIALRGGPDPTQVVQSEFSDDPQMFGAIYGFEQSKTEAINTRVKACLEALSTQLAELPLNGGDAQGVVQSMLKALEGGPREASNFIDF